jgi:prepilin-type N-terminal cleavage/methylation domain-containing protein
MKKIKTDSLFTNHPTLISNSTLGFTLIEALVAVTIVALLARIIAINLINFQKDARLESFADQFASNLQSARNKSVSAEIPSGYVLSDFDANNLPYWVVEVTANKFSLYSKFKLSSGSDATGNSEDTAITGGNTLTPTGLTTFERLTGKTSATCFTLGIANYSKVRNVFVDANGNVGKQCP